MKVTLDSTGVYHLPKITTRVPMTVTLQSSAANRKIEISANEGDSFFTPVYDSESPTELVVVIFAPTTDIKATGAAGDILDVTL